MNTDFDSVNKRKKNSPILPYFYHRTFSINKGRAGFAPSDVDDIDIC